MSVTNAPVEANTRWLIDKSLENLGWILDVNSAERNVFLEQPKTKEEIKLLGGEKPDYVLYAKDERGEDKAIIVIEAKRPGKRIDAALEQGIRYAKALDAPIVFATDGHFCKSYHTKFNRSLILNGDEVDEILKEALAIKYLTSWEVNTISQKVRYDRRELIKIFDEANNMLRGDGLRAGIERFGEFANILFIKLVSENSQILYESGKKSNLDSACRWDSIKGIPSSARIDYINNTVFTRLNDFYKTIIFTPLTIRSEEILNEIMDKLDPLTLTEVDSDVKGSAFEYFLRESTATKNDLGEYFTPRHIVKAMVRIVNPKFGEKVYDPFCGTGGFLIESFRHIQNFAPKNETTEEILTKKTIYGNEITNTARIAKMNMILAGDGHSNIHTKDSLANPIDGKKEYEVKQPDGNIVKRHEGYDVVITNMPYSQKTKFGHFYDMPSHNGDSICVRHCMKAINSSSENGRMALVVPEGFLFRKDLSKTRELLLKSCDLQSIISLPQGVFLPYTGVKTNIIYATKVNQNLKSSQKRKDFWYFNVKSDGYTLDNHRRKLDSGSDLDKYQEYRKLDDDQRQDMLDAGFEVVWLDKIKKNSYILVGSRYREHTAILSAYNTVPLGEMFVPISETVNPQTKQGEVCYVGLENIEANTGMLVGMEKTDIKAIKSIKKEFRKGDILYSRLRPNLNKVWYACFNGICSTDIVVLRPKNDSILAKLYAILFRAESFKTKVLNGVSGGQLPRVDIKYLLSIPIIKLSLEEQKRVLDELESYQRIINHAKGISENYVPLINYRPEWKRVKLGNVCDFAGGTQPPKSTFKFDAEDGYIRLLQIRDYKNDDYKTYIPVSERHKTCSEDDIMIGRYGPPVFQILRGKSGAYNVALMKCVPDESKVSKDWLFYFLNSAQIQDYVIGLSMRGRQAGVSPDDLRKLDLPLPSIAIQKQIVDELKAEQKMVESSKQLADTLLRKIQNRINEIWGE